MESWDDVGPELPGLARRAVAAELSGHALDTLDRGPAAPVFVTIRCADGALRGCMGTLAAAEPHVTREVARNAVLAATRDPRFPPVTGAELGELSFEVSVLLPEEAVPGLEQLDPARFGVVVRDAAGRRGVLLPEVPGVESAAQQVEIARHKAGIPDGAVAQLTRFAVRKYRE
ncbi:MAG TPA: AmmeMemoRadiSam system protein A [Polyangiaceae bacterium]|nr:AmmeMemoRadiSam system protein A [Polyangiaceae bacterium]